MSGRHSSGWKNQTICHLIIEGLTEEKFISVRPDWLKNPLTGRNMELDCYNGKLKIALEYNGKQHYKYTPAFHKDKYCAYDGKIVTGKRHFELQVFRDEAKKSLCDKYGIYLLIVPYTIDRSEMVSYILSKLHIIYRQLLPQ